MISQGIFISLGKDRDMPSNRDPFAPWNGPDRDDPFKPWNGPDRDDPFAPWNNPFGTDWSGRYRKYDYDHWQ